MKEIRSIVISYRNGIDARAARGMFVILVIYVFNVEEVIPPTVIEEKENIGRRIREAIAMI